MFSPVNNLEKVFAVLKPNQAVEKVTVTPSIYQDLDENFNHFKDHQLVSMYEFSEDWSSWEIHPKGDEVVVPQNTWHTARTKTTTKALFITPGEGTENKSV